MLFKNAKIVDKNGERENLVDILVKDGVISKIGMGLSNKDAIDLKGCYVFPTLVDLHVHFREPGFEYKEDIKTGSMAALHGGYSICYAMGNTKPVCDNLHVYQSIIDKARDLDLIDLYQVIVVTKDLGGEDLVDIIPPSDARFFSDDGKGIKSNYIMLKALEKAKNGGYGIMVHAEDSDISPFDYRIAEDIITLRDCYLAEVTGARIHFSHVSTRGAIEIIKTFKKRGADITMEVCPHHLSQIDESYRVNPPIRKEDDILALIEGIKDGTVDAISTDHAPHSKEDKANGAPGMIGLESAFLVLYELLIGKGIVSLEKLIDLMAIRPAKIIGIDHGEIEEGKTASFFVFNPLGKTDYNEGYILSKSKNTPYLDRSFKGSIDYTIRKDKIYKWRDYDNR